MDPQQVALSAEFSHVSFVIPVRVDTADRYWNLKVVVGFLTKNFPAADILIVEQDSESNIGELLGLYPNVRHLLLLDGGTFKKVEGINFGALHADRRYVCIYDADVLVSPTAIVLAVRAMERKGWKIVVPHNYIYLDVRGALREHLGVSGNLDGYQCIRSLTAASQVPEASARFIDGGIFLVHREVFLAEGGSNRKMVSYGWEDTELLKRLSILGYPVLCMPAYNLIHLDHARGADSCPNEHYERNGREYRRVAAMSRQELMQYVQSELSLTCRGDAAALAEIRAAARASRPKYWIRAKAKFNLFRVHVQAHGLMNLFAARVLPRVRRRI